MSGLEGYSWHSLYPQLTGRHIVEKFFENFGDIFCDLPFGDFVLFSFSVIIHLSKSNIL